jgi:hypothetical protein
MSPFDEQYQQYRWDNLVQLADVTLMIVLHTHALPWSKPKKWVYAGFCRYVTVRLVTSTYKIQSKFSIACMAKGATPFYPRN